MPVLLALLASPMTRDAEACACGCGVFDVGASTLLPVESESGLSLWLRVSYMDQNQNWEGDSKAPAADNSDKAIKSSFYTLGVHYMIDRSWTLMAELPAYSRSLTTTDDGTVFGPAGSIYTAHLTDLGDFQLTGLYTGFSPDLSTGLGLGVKLPTGNYTGPTGPLGGAEFDRDSLPGTGSTDLIVAAYHLGGLNPSRSLAYFVQARYQLPTFTRNAYRPGSELDGAAGLSYSFHAFGPLDNIAPVLQVIGSDRGSDSGANADPLNSGYRRLLAAIGVELRVRKLRLYADVELPFYQHTDAAASVASEGTSGQLVASALFRSQLEYDF